MILRVLSGNTEIPLTNGPVAVGMKMVYQPASSYVRQDSEEAVFCARYKGGADSIVWRLTSQGLLYMDAVLLNLHQEAEVSMMLSWIRRYIIWD